MATTPQYTSTPKVGIVSIATANTSYDGSGTIGTVITGATNGTRIDEIYIAASATTTAGVVSLFISDTTGANTNTNTHLIQSFVVSAITPSATTAPFQTVISSQTRPDLLPIFLPNGYTLRAATTKAENFRVVAIGGDF